MSTIVIGGGAAGLAAARTLALSEEVTLIESDARVGGLIHTTRESGALFEWGPDSLLESKPGTSEWIERLGLGDQTVFGGSRSQGSYVSRAGALVAIPSGFMAPSSVTQALKIATSPLFSARGTGRLLLEPFAKRSAAEDESVEAFVCRRFGSEFHDRLVAPVIGGIHAAPLETLSAAIALGPLFSIEKKYGSIARSLVQNPSRSTKPVRFVSFQDGMRTLVAALAKPRVRTLVGEPAHSVRREKNRWIVRVGHETLSADSVVLATPPWVSRDLFSDSHPEIADALGDFNASSLGIVNLVFATEQVSVPTGSGYVVSREHGSPLVRACTFSTQKFPYRSDAAEFLFRCFLSQTDGTDAELIAASVEELRKTVQLKGMPRVARALRLKNRLIRFEVGHRDRIARVRALAHELGPIAFCGSAFEGPGVIDALRSGERAAKEILTAGGIKKESEPQDLASNRSVAPR